MPTPQFALSIKQPWATLLVHGLKTVEVRVWSTARRGRILIHASRIPDARPEVAALVPKSLLDQSKVLGGIIGSAELTDCREYRSLESFEAEHCLHLNDPSWFRPPVLYGFRFANAKPLPFRRYPGWMRFFPVEEVQT